MKDIFVVMRTIIRDSWWVTRNWGLLAGSKFFWNTTIRNLKQLFHKEEDLPRFEDLTDEEAQNCAWAFGLYKWESREDLNRQWNDLMEGLQRRY